MGRTAHSVTGALVCDSGQKLVPVVYCATSNPNPGFPLNTCRSLEIPVKQMFLADVNKSSENKTSNISGGKRKVMSKNAKIRLNNFHWNLPMLFMEIDNILMVFLVFIIQSGSL